ncbi:MAG: hypothetical protein CMB68_05015 [Euryarchaeota archaeon]|nr:hypothetical protein [Euryarchaeota archaeon]|tara:strand:- start:9173 stop:9838 length:666 start_codon:yes stop_codon:yes gene_type:complete
MEMRGTVRFRFRSAEYDVDVLLEGEARWVEDLRQQIGLSGDVGVLQPLAARMTDPDEDEPESAVGDRDSDYMSASEGEAVLPGPTPDPSRIPAVIRKIGEFDLETSMSELGGRKSSDPDMSAICEILDELEEEVEPLSDTLSGDPLAEAWIQLLLTLVVREHGHTSLPLSSFEMALGERLNRDAAELGILLDRLWMMGRLERIHGGAETEYSPNPSWMQST